MAITDADEVVLVQLDRHDRPPGWVPAGGTDGEQPLVAAQRELEEESGYRARQWREIGRMNALNGICRAPEVVFLATGLRAGPGTWRPGRKESARAHRALARVMEMVRTGEICDGETVAALMYAALALGRL